MNWSSNWSCISVHNFIYKLLWYFPHLHKCFLIYSRLVKSLVPLWTPWIPCLEEDWSIYFARPIHSSVLYLQVTLCHSVDHKEVPSFGVFGLLVAAEVLRFSKIMALVLSCITLLCEILYPWAYMKYPDHIILVIAPFTTISFPSVGVFPFIFGMWRNWTLLLCPGKL